MEVTLITETVEKDPGGLPCKSGQKETTVYAEEKSVVRSEFYQAMRAGITPKAVFEIRQEDFELSAIKTDKGVVYPAKLISDGTKYGIARTYRKGKSKIELTCM